MTSEIVDINELCNALRRWSVDGTINVQPDAEFEAIIDTPVLNPNVSSSDDQLSTKKEATPEVSKPGFTLPINIGPRLYPVLSPQELKLRKQRKVWYQEDMRDDQELDLKKRIDQLENFAKFYGATTQTLGQRIDELDRKGKVAAESLHTFKTVSSVLLFIILLVFGGILVLLHSLMSPH